MAEPWKDVEIEERLLPMLAQLQVKEEDDQTGLTPEEREAATEQREAFDAMCVEKEAQFAVFAIEKALQQFIHKRIRFEDELKAEAVRDFAPLLAKYGVLLPSWLGQYQEEIMALKAAGSLGMSALSQAKQYKEEDRVIQLQQQQHKEESQPSVDSLEQMEQAA
ncbi:hypothetical protein ACB087_04100 [Vibrio sp. VNB-15]